MSEKYSTSDNTTHEASQPETTYVYSESDIRDDMIAREAARDADVKAQYDRHFESLGDDSRSTEGGTVETFSEANPERESKIATLASGTLQTVSIENPGKTTYVYSESDIRDDMIAREAARDADVKAQYDRHFESLGDDSVK